MRIVRSCFVIIFLSLLTHTVSSQSSSYKVSAKSVSLVSLINLLEKEYNVQFSYPSDLLTDQVFDINTSTPDLSNILNEITALYPLEYQLLDDKTVLLRERLSKTLQNVQKSKDVTVIIKDRSDGLPLPAAAVGISGTTIGGYTDEDGTVSFTSPRSSIIIQVHLLGYKTISINLKEIENGEIFLDAQTFEIEEVMIQDRPDVISTKDHSVSINARHISSLNVGLAGTDVMRQIQLLPGITSFNDASSKLKIRGGDDEGTLIIIDDIPLYDASHYYGMFSSINPTYISDATLYKNNLPIIYDGKMDGMLKVDGLSSDPNKKTQGQVDLSLLTIAASINHSFSNNLFLSLGARSSLRNASDTGFSSLLGNNSEMQTLQEEFSLTDRRTLFATIPDFSFYDANGKLSYKWNKGSLSLNYFRSNDDLDDTFENQFNTRRDRTTVLNTEQYFNTEDWSNEGASLKLRQKLSSTLSLESLLYGSSFSNYSTIGLSVTRKTRINDRTFSATNARENYVNDLGFKSVLKRGTTKVSWNLGVDVIAHETISNIANDNNDVIRRKGDGVEASLFGSVGYKLSDKFLVDFGLRGTVFKDNFYAAPRLNLTYNPSEGLNLKSSIGRHNQYVRQLSFENAYGRAIDFWALANNNIDVGNTDQLMIGATYKTGRVSFDVEGYYKKRYNLLEQALLAPRFDEANVVPQQINETNYRLFRGDGKTIGLDFLFGYTLSKYSGWVSYTLSKSTISFDQILRGTPFPTQDDRRHQLNVVNEYRIGKWSLGSTMVYASGRPYTDLNKISSNPRDQLTSEERISRLPAYIRTDLGASYKFELGESTLDVGLSVYNLLNRANVNYIQYIFSIPTNTSQNPDRNINTLLGTESNLLNRTLNLNVSYTF